LGEFSIVDILKVILKRIWAVSIAAVLCGSLAFVYCTMFATPTYQAKASVLGSNGNIGSEITIGVTTGGNTIQSGDLAASIALTETYVVMLTKMPSESQDFVNRLVEEDLLDIYKQSQIEITAQEDTLVIEISVISTDAKAAQSIANIYAECSSTFVEDYNIGMIKTISKARDTKQVSPRTLMTTFFAAFLGMAVVALFVVYIDLSDRTINGEEDIRANYDIPVLGMVPDFQVSSKGGKK